jgi:hypothetical protein
MLASSTPERAWQMSHVGLCDGCLVGELLCFGAFAPEWDSF